jgi:hypothetical protein
MQVNFKLCLSGLVVKSNNKQWAGYKFHFVVRQSASYEFM